MFNGLWEVCDSSLAVCCCEALPVCVVLSIAAHVCVSNYSRASLATGLRHDGNDAAADGEGGGGAVQAECNDGPPADALRVRVKAPGSKPTGPFSVFCSVSLPPLFVLVFVLFFNLCI